MSDTTRDTDRNGESIPSDLLALLRCLECGRTVHLDHLSEQPGYPELGPDGRLLCERCGESYPLIAGTVRMLPRPMRSRLQADYPLAREAFEEGSDDVAPGSEGLSHDVKQQTADSFAYEWQRFGGLREEWRKNFIDYMQPHKPENFTGRMVLDVGTGSGRHSFHAAELGARVVAVDIGRSIDVARVNLPPGVLTVQADAEQLPFEQGTFDFVMSIGVLVNDQFDRFSAPLERRYTRAEVLAMLQRAGLTDESVVPNHGWVGDGRVVAY